MLNWYEGYLDTNPVLLLAIDKMKVVFEFYFSDVTLSAQQRNRKSLDVSERSRSATPSRTRATCASRSGAVAKPSERAATPKAWTKITRSACPCSADCSRGAYGAGRLSVRREAGENLFYQPLFMRPVLVHVISRPGSQNGNPG